MTHISLSKEFGEIQDVLVEKDDDYGDNILMPRKIIFKSGKILNISAEEGNTGAYPIIDEI
jgi:hypothetical protein